VALEELDPRGAAAHAAEERAARRVRDLLVGDGLEVLAHPEPAGVAGAAQRRQDVVGSDHLVAVGHAGVLAEEEGAVVAHPLQRLSRFGGEDLHVLGREGVADLPELVHVVDHDHLSVVPPRGFGEVLGRHPGQDLVDQADDLLGERARGRDQHRGGVGAVLGLRQQVDSDGERVGALVGQHEDLRRAGEQVDAHLAEQLALRLGHVGVARTGQEVDPLHRFGADRHRRHGLDTAEHVDLVRPGHAHRRDRRGRDLAADRRSAGNDPRDAGYLRGHHRHVGRGRERVATPGHVSTGGRDRDVPVTEAYAGERLDLDVEHGVPLDLREPTHLALHELDVLEHLVREGVDERPHLVRVEPEAVGRPGVEPAGVLAHGRVAAGPHVRDDLGDPVRNVALRAVGERGGGCALQVLGHLLSCEFGNRLTRR
jgi:hypothetical protein